MDELATFFDTSFISEAPLQDLRYFLQFPGEKYLLNTVLQELQEGQKAAPKDKKFKYFFEPNGKLKRKFKVISVENCNKELKDIDFNNSVIYIKKNSMLCSTYYKWLSSAINPSIITDPYRHIYNLGMFEIKSKGDANGSISRFLGGMRQEEIQGLRQIRAEQGRKPEGFYETVLKSTRKKRLRDFKNNSLKLTDFQNVLVALIFVCYQRKNVMLITCDRDLIDIKDNLIRCAIEKYTINQMLFERLKDIESSIHRFNNDKIFLYREEVFNQILATLKKTRESTRYRGIQVAYYDRNDRKVYGEIERLPLWLMDFILEYKLNLDCYTLNKNIELKYPIRYIMDPTKNPEKIYFKINIKKEPFYDDYMVKCNDKCIFVRSEIENPTDFTGFI